MSLLRTSSEKPSPDLINDLEWANSNLGPSLASVYHITSPIIRLERIDFSNAGGYCAEMFKLKLFFEDGSSVTVVHKMMPESKYTTSRYIELPREAIFYEQFQHIIQDMGVRIPKVVYSYGDISTGEKVLIMEDLSEGIQCGYFYGPYSPHNWGKNLEEITAPAIKKSTVDELSTEITRSAYLAAAKLHANYWKDESLLDKPWLRGTGWYRGEDEQKWVASQNQAHGSWLKTKEKIANNESKVKWNQNVIDCVDASFAKISWTNYLEERESRSWSLVHGDFHPANMMWIPESESGPAQLVLLDWEMIGIANGPQDVAQYGISHMCREARKRAEENDLPYYYENLLKHSNGKITAETFSYEQCKREYVSGGSDRWMWMLALLTGMCPDIVLQYFHDQVMYFLEDHNLNPENIGMPRV